jgi:hypothetical protein
MHVLTLPPAKPEHTVSAATGGATTFRPRTRRTFAAVALLAVSMAATLSLPSMASERHVESATIPTTTNLKASAYVVKVKHKVTLTATVTPSQAAGEVILYLKAPSKAFEAVGTAKVVNGVAKGQGILPKVGAYKFKVVYKASKFFGRSVSNTITIVAKK